MAIPTVTSSQQRRVLALRRGNDEAADPFAGLGAVVAALRGMTSVAAEGAAKEVATEAASRPPMEVKARVTNDGKTIYDLKNVSVDGDPQELAQRAYDEPNDRFVQKFMALRRSEPTGALSTRPVMDVAREQERVAAPEQIAQPSVGEMLSATADDLGLPTTDRAAIESELQSFGGQYRAQRDAGSNPFAAVLRAAFVKALPATAESAVRSRQADAQVERRIYRLGKAYGVVAPLVNMYQQDRDQFINMMKHASTMEERSRDNVMTAMKALADNGAPVGVDPEEYVAKLSGLSVLPEPFRPLVQQTLIERERKMTNAAEAEGRAEKRDERADASAERAERAAERAASAEVRSQERFNVAMAKVAEATREKPYKYTPGDSEVMTSEYLVSRIGDESSDQSSLERTLQRQLKKNSTQFDKLTAERTGLSAEYRDLKKKFEAAQKRVEKSEYAPGAVSRVAQLETRILQITKRIEEIDALRKPIQETIATVQDGLSSFSVDQDEWDALIALGRTPEDLRRQGIRVRK